MIAGSKFIISYYSTQNNVKDKLNVRSLSICLITLSHTHFFYSVILFLFNLFIFIIIFLRSMFGEAANLRLCGLDIKLEIKL